MGILHKAYRVHFVKTYIPQIEKSQKKGAQNWTPFYLKSGSDRFVSLRCHPQWASCTKPTVFASRILYFFHWGRSTTQVHFSAPMKKASQLTLEGFVEGKGFEPSVSLRPTHAFQACSLNHSDTPLNGLQK